MASALKRATQMGDFEVAKGGGIWVANRVLGYIQQCDCLFEAFFHQSLSDKFAIEVSHISLFAQTVEDSDGSRLYI
jgi:hypothetical protein